MTSEKEYLTGSRIPGLLYFSDEPRQAARRGTILFYHGLIACKETNAKELNSLAEAGFLAVGIDNVGHGERSNPALEDLKKKLGFESVFLKMVTETVDEIPAIIDFLLDERCAVPGKIGICGISMGGYIAYGGVVMDSRINVAAPILGSPVWKHTRSPHLTPDKFYPTALLTQNAGSDESVPPHYAKSFHEKLLPYYKNATERLSHIEHPGEPHIMSPQGWERLWQNTVEWFERFMR